MTDLDRSEPITVFREEANGDLTGYEFTGTWLVYPDDDWRYGTRTEMPGHDAGLFWGVALTAKGHIVVTVTHCNSGGHTFKVYDSLEEADMPADIRARAAREMGQPITVQLDI